MLSAGACLFDNPIDLARGQLVGPSFDGSLSNGSENRRLRRGKANIVLYANENRSGPAPLFNYDTASTARDLVKEFAEL